MSICTEYKKYYQSGGTLSKEEYGIHLDHIKTKIGVLINSDPNNLASDIGKRVFEYLDLGSGIAFTRVSKGFYERGKKRWLVGKAREVVLLYVRQGASYSDYFLKDGGWQDVAYSGAVAVAAAVAIFSGVEASIHASQIPPDAPTRTITTTDEYGQIHEYTVPDHPEYVKAVYWGFTSGITGAISASVLLHKGIKCLLSDLSLPAFFNASEKEIIESEKINFLQKKSSPDFYEWKVKKMRENLTSNPGAWSNHEVLRKFICPLSGDFMLFPVKDSCDEEHEFDYRSVVAYQLNVHPNRPHECPIASKKPNLGWLTIRFNKGKFDYIQRIIHQMNQ